MYEWEARDIRKISKEFYTNWMNFHLLNGMMLNMYFAEIIHVSHFVFCLFDL